MRAQYPNLLVLEVKKTVSGAPLSSSYCNSWKSTFGLTHTLLRDDGQVQSKLSMGSSDILVMDRQLKIVYRGGPAYLSSVRSAVLGAVSALK